LKKNVKAIASLVRKAKKKIYQGKREEALELMRKAVSLDDNSGVLVQVISVIGRKKVKAGFDAGIQAEKIEEISRAAESETTQEEQPAPESGPEAAQEEYVLPYENREKRRDDGKTLKKLFDASDMEFDNGNHQNAMVHLRKAQKLFPEDPRVKEKIALLNTRMKAASLVKLAENELDAGEPAKAVVLVREAFNTYPGVPGLEWLLDRLEESVEKFRGEDIEAADGITPAEEYIARIRELVQENTLVDAAKLAAKAHSIHPDDSLLQEFVDNFKKLGLLE